MSNEIHSRPYNEYMEDQMSKIHEALSGSPALRYPWHKYPPAFSMIQRILWEVWRNGNETTGQEPQGAEQ